MELSAIAKMILATKDALIYSKSPVVLEIWEKHLRKEKLWFIREALYRLEKRNTPIFLTTILEEIERIKKEKKGGKRNERQLERRS